MKRLAALTPILSGHHQEDDSHVYDYLIVGAGISGIQALQILTQKHKNIILLEAQERFGGRIETEAIGDLPAAKGVGWVQGRLNHFKNVFIEKGATWIEKKHHILLKMCQEFGIPLKEQYSKGCNIYLAKDTAMTNQQLTSNPSFSKPLYDFIARLDELAIRYDRQVLSTSPQEARQSKVYKELLTVMDSQTVAEYIRRNVNSSQGQVADFLTNFYQHTECAPCKDNSMHELLFKHARSNDIGIIKEFLGAYGHEESYLVEGGTYVVVEKLLEVIRERFERDGLGKGKKGLNKVLLGSSLMNQSTNSFQSLIRLNYEVVRIDNSNPSLIVVTARDRKDNKEVKFRTKKVICSQPIATTKSIEFIKISPAKSFIFNRQLATTCMKSFMIFPTPFWQSLGATGDCLFSNDWMVNMCHDISPENESCGILVLFHSGEKYERWMKYGEEKGSNTERIIQTHANDKGYMVPKHRYLLTMIARLFSLPPSHPALADSIYHSSTFLTNPYTRSGFQSLTSPTTFTQLLEKMNSTHHVYSREEAGILFLGSEYSEEFASYVEGAIRVARAKIYKEIGLNDPYKEIIAQK